MSTNDSAGDDEGARAPSAGTPMPVDLGADREARRTWALLVGGPVVWFTHFMLVYLVSEAGCTGEGPGLRLFDPPVPTILTLATTGIAVVACAAIAAVTWRRWRESEQDLQGAPDAADDVEGKHDEDRRLGSLAFAGFLLATLSVLAVLFTGAPAMAFLRC